MFAARLRQTFTMQMSSLFVYGYPLANSQKSQRLIMASCDASVMASHNEYS